MVIVILGVVGGMVAVFMRGPIDAYFASARRAALTDVADTAVRRISRDLRTSLPNSLLIKSAQCLQFIPTKTGGRYRTADTTLNDDTSLDFGRADTSFNMLSRNSALPPNQQIVVNDVIAVYNLGIAGANAYLGNNTTVVRAAPTESASPPPSETTIPITGKQFPLASGTNRFHVIPAGEPVVAYVCANSALYRRAYSGDSNCGGTGAPGFLREAILARNVSDCSFETTGPDLQRNALVNINLQITDMGETVSLQQTVNVNNTP